MSERADVIVVGMGPGGEDVAGRLAEAGLDVVGVEAELVGGECPYWGCVPSKMMIRAADLLAEAGRVDGLAGSADGAAGLGARWRAGSGTRPPTPGTTPPRPSGSRTRAAGCVRGWGRLEGPGGSSWGTRCVEADRAVVVNIGTRASIPPVAGLADTPYWTNREAVETEEVPASLAVLGGGAIGVELAQVFRRFGAEVTVLEAGPGWSVPRSPKPAACWPRCSSPRGSMSGPASSSSRSTTTATVSPSPLGAGEPVVADRLLVATGRRRRSGPAQRGVRRASTSRPGSLPVDDHLRVDGAEGCGPSVTSPAMGPSPTSRCTRPTSS